MPILCFLWHGLFLGKFQWKTKRRMVTNWLPPMIVPLLIDKGKWCVVFLFLKYRWINWMTLNTLYIFLKICAGSVEVCLNIRMKGSKAWKTLMNSNFIKHFFNFSLKKFYTGNQKNNWKTSKKKSCNKFVKQYRKGFQGIFRYSIPMRKKHLWISPQF